jgi:hypothetical protein
LRRAGCGTAPLSILACEAIPGGGFAQFVLLAFAFALHAAVGIAWWHGDVDRLKSGNNFAGQRKTVSTFYESEVGWPPLAPGMSYKDVVALQLSE